LCAISRNGIPVGNRRRKLSKFIPFISEKQNIFLNKDKGLNGTVVNGKGLNGIVVNGKG